MTKFLIKKLAMASYARNKIDHKRVMAIAENLTRRQLKEYIKQLKLIEAKRNVIVEMTREDSELKKRFQKMFPGNNVIIKEAPELMLGFRITKDYTIYKFNLKDKLAEMVEFIEND